MSGGKNLLLTYVCTERKTPLLLKSRNHCPPFLFPIYIYIYIYIFCIWTFSWVKWWVRHNYPRDIITSCVQVRRGADAHRALVGCVLNRMVLFQDLQKQLQCVGRRKQDLPRKDLGSWFRHPCCTCAGRARVGDASHWFTGAYKTCCSLYPEPKTCQ